MILDLSYSESNGTRSERRQDKTATAKTAIRNLEESQNGENNNFKAATNSTSVACL